MNFPPLQLHQIKNPIKTPIVSFVYRVLNGNNVYEEYHNCMENIKNE